MFLLRHGEAAPGIPDAERALTPRGRDQVRLLVETLDWSCLQDVRSIEHSGLVRARQTAEELAGRLDRKLPLAIRPGLRPNDDPRIIAQDLVTSRHDRLLVGHNPHLEALAGLLLGGGLMQVPLVVKKAGWLCLEREKSPDKERPLGRWVLLWLLSPRRFRNRDEA